VAGLGIASDSGEIRTDAISQGDRRSALSAGTGRVMNAYRHGDLEGCIALVTGAAGILAMGLVKSEEEFEVQMAAATPTGRNAEACEIAAVVAFLCSESASYVSGSRLVADGAAQAV
jgi:enoyl-[acyl-carrier-protein] reductase (NADH)